MDVVRVFRGEDQIEIGLSFEKGDEGEIKGIIASVDHHPFDGILMYSAQVEVLSDKYMALQHLRGP